MTWGQIKKAVEEAEISDSEEIALIQCENRDGDHTFRKVRLGQMIKLAENSSNEAARREAEGCAI